MQNVPVDPFRLYLYDIEPINKKAINQEGINQEEFEVDYGPMNIDDSPNDRQ